MTYSEINKDNISQLAPAERAAFNILLSIEEYTSVFNKGKLENERFPEFVKIIEKEFYV